MNYYWITRLDAINWFLFVFIITLAASLLFVIIDIWCNNYKPNGRITYKIFWTNLFLFILFILIYLFVPTTEQAYIIWGI
jgi:uncharacterized BrkB/YihY/UPF0761 family membrane protein